MIRIYGEDEALAKERTKMSLADIAYLLDQGECGCYVYMDGELWTIYEGTEVER